MNTAPIDPLSRTTPLLHLSLSVAPYAGDKRGGEGEWIGGRVGGGHGHSLRRTKHPV